MLLPGLFKPPNCKLLLTSAKGPIHESTDRIPARFHTLRACWNIGLLPAANPTINNLHI